MIMLKHFKTYFKLYCLIFSLFIFDHIFSLLQNWQKSMENLLEDWQWVQKKEKFEK